MIRVALCDDEAQCLDDTRRMVEQWSSDCGITVRITCFDNADALILSIRSSRPDVIFLDIMMPLLNGMDAAREIRELDKTVEIVFLTSSSEFALESYGVKARGYVLKPVKFEQLTEILDEYAAALNEEPKNLLLKSAFGYHKIFLRDIQYIEAQNKQVLFYLRSNQSIAVTQPLYSFEDKLLTEDGFFKCHRSYIVSMTSVNSFSLSEITMKSGSRIPIARGAGKAFQDAYFAFMFGD